MRHALLMAIALLAAAPTAAQTPAATRNPGWTARRTPDGHPDLQGPWLNNSATPLERPKELEGKPRFSDEEVAELKRRAARIFDAGVNSDFAGGDGFFLALLANPDRYRNPNSTGGSDAMVDREIEDRTSLIEDPADGRIPPLTPEGQQRVSSRPAPVGGGFHGITRRVRRTSVPRFDASRMGSRALAPRTSPTRDLWDTTRSSRHRITWRSRWRPSTRSASFRWRRVRIFLDRFACGTEIRAAGGRATHSSSRRRTLRPM